MSSGNSTHSRVRPRQNPPGWITNDSPSGTTTSSVRFSGGWRRSIAEARWLWNTRNESPTRRSTLAGWTRLESHGSIRIRPAFTRAIIVPSDRTEAAPRTPGRALLMRAHAPQVCHGLPGSSVAVTERPRLCTNAANPRGGRRCRVTVRTAARAARKRSGRMRALALHAAVIVGRRRLVGLLLDGPPDKVDERSKG